jgi:heme exporter protein B
MLPVLLYPLLIPLLIGAMELTTGLLNGNAVLSDIRLLIVFDVVYTSLAIMLIEFILVI